MFKVVKAFSSFSVNDLTAARNFYSDILRIEVTEDKWGLKLVIPGTAGVFIYQKDDHVPATYTVLNFPVVNIGQSVDELSAKGVVFDRQDLGNGAITDSKGVLRGIASGMGPDIAWFKDPSGNILSVLQEG